MTSSSPPDDTSAQSSLVLLARYRAGEHQALEKLLRRCYPRVERIVRVRLGPALKERDGIADVVQDVFVRIVEGLEKFEARTDSRWIDWVARLAQHEIADHARRAGAKKRGGALAERVRAVAESEDGSPTPADLPADSTAVPSRAARRELTELVDRCLSELSEPHREVILLRDYAGEAWAAIAEQMGRPSPEACQELHRRARRELGRKFRFVTG